MKNSEFMHKVYGVHVLTDEKAAQIGNHTMMEVVEMAIKGGAAIIQLRNKTADDTRMLDEAMTIIELMRKNGIMIPLIINDAIEVVLKVRDELENRREFNDYLLGVHVGQTDLLDRRTTSQEIRKEIGPDIILGISATNLEEAVQIAREGVADYIGLGPIFPTLSKSDATPPIGLDGLHAVRQSFDKEGFSMPLIAIGGISLGTIEQVAPYVHGVAVIGAVGKAIDPQQTTRELLSYLVRPQVR